MYSCSSEASGSRPDRFHSSQKPLLLNGVHGGPPRSSVGRSPLLNPAASRISSVLVSKMSFWITGDERPGKFFSIVSAASRLCSTAARTWNPACSAPRSRPPAPEKREIATPLVLTMHKASHDPPPRTGHAHGLSTGLFIELLRQQKFNSPCRLERKFAPERVEGFRRIEFSVARAEVFNLLNRADVLARG
ncbi:Uncharacterised protein [Mycobacteroides abscessus subsp. abscessus]|nr:Uncharacterised protein [Mycobacteroides abscessus subsp. abscessus]